MRGRNQRNKGGELRKIRSDTKMKTLKERYGVDFPCRGDMTWGTFCRRHGVGSLKEAIEKFHT